MELAAWVILAGARVAQAERDVAQAWAIVRMVWQATGMAAIVATAVIGAMAAAIDLATAPAFTLVTSPMTTGIAITGTTVASVAIKHTKF